MVAYSHSEYYLQSPLSRTFRDVQDGEHFKVGKSKKVPEAEQIRVENTHEPLVSQEIFDGANAKF